MSQCVTPLSDRHVLQQHHKSQVLIFHTGYRNRVIKFQVTTKKESIVNVIIYIRPPASLQQSSSRGNVGRKNGLILPKGQWYVPWAVINDACYCMVLYGITWYYIVLRGIALYCKVLHGIAWCCMVLHGIALYCMVLHGIAWYCMVLHCIAKYWMVLHGIAWYCMELHCIA